MKAVLIDFDWRPELSVYASPDFLKTVSDDCGWIGGVDPSGRLRCILPYTIVRKATVRMARFRVETIPVGEGIDIQEEKAFLNSALDCLRSLGVDLVIPASTNTIFRTYPDKAKAAPYGTLILDLTPSEEDLWRNVHSKHRNVIRNAMNKGVVIHSGNEYMKTAHEMIRDTFGRSKMGFMDFGAMEKMIRGLGDNVRIFVAVHEGVVQGCAVIPFSLWSAYYAYGGTAVKPLSGATNLLQWEAIKSFKALGVRRYDFCGVRIDPEEGSKQAGLIMYKERFGPRLHQGYMWKYNIHRVKSAVYSLAIRVLRGGDIVDGEHHKLKRS